MTNETNKEIDKIIDEFRKITKQAVWGNLPWKEVDKFLRQVLLSREKVVEERMRERIREIVDKAILCNEECAMADISLALNKPN